MSTENHRSSEQLLEQAEEMIWNLLDENLPESDVAYLETLIKENDQVRSLYLDCVQLHADLSGHFGKLPQGEAPSAPSTPVLGSLGDVMRGFDTGPPVAN
jgi:hypothetical protein